MASGVFGGSTHRGWLVRLGGASILAALIASGCWFGSPAQVPSWRDIQSAADSRRWADLEAGLRRWLRAYPDDGDAWAMLGDLLFDQGRDPEALTSLRHVEETNPAWGHARTLIAELAIRQRDLAGAERVLRGVAERDRRASEPLRRLVYILNLERRSAEARSVLLRLYEITKDPHYLADSMLTRWADADVREVGPELAGFLERHPKDPWLRRAWGLFLLSRGRPDEALPHLEAAAAAFEDDPAGLFALAECRMALGAFDGDLTILGTRPTRAVDAARWWVLRGRLQEAWGAPDEAVESLRQAVASDPACQEAHFRLGQAFLRRGRPEEAGPFLERADALRERERNLRSKLARLPERVLDADTAEQLGHLCLEAGLHTEARAWFEQAIRLEPRRGRPGSELARLATMADDRPVVGPGPRLRTSPGGSSSPARDPDAAGSGGGPGNGRGDGRIVLEDISSEALINFSYDCGNDANLFIADTMGGGVGLIDHDGDGWLDVYFVNGCSLPFDPGLPPRPNRLYRNLGDGTFEDVTGRAGVAGEGYGMGCAVGDFDDDGHDDLFVTGLDRTILYRNRGDGTFEDVTRAAGVSSSRWTTAAGFGDLDRDGDLDLVAIAYVEADPGDIPDCRDESGRPIHCPPDRFPAQFDHLFRNNGDGTFTDVSRAAGIEVPEGRGLGLAIADLDGDGLLDLFVANDGTANFLFRNLGGLRFEEIAQGAGVSHDGSGQATASMGVVADDLNGDGLIDLFHTNFINQSSTLRWNLGGGLFADRTLWANLSAPSRSRTGFGAAALDADNDGQLDLFVANGHVDDQPWFNTPMAQTAQLFLARGGGRFAIAGDDVSPYFSRPLVGRGVAAGDLDNDGRVDLVVVHRDAPAVVLRNRTRGGHWLGLRLRGTESGSSPVGARVACRIAGRETVRWQSSGTSYLSSNDPRIWFGLGSARVVDRLEVAWPSGAVQSWLDVPADQILDLREGNPALSTAVRPTEGTKGKIPLDAEDDPGPPDEGPGPAPRGR
jgi:tetratricopeptide (TPR) repeat protein